MLKQNTTRGQCVYSRRVYVFLSITTQVVGTEGVYRYQQKIVSVEIEILAKSLDSVRRPIARPRPEKMNQSGDGDNYKTDGDGTSPP